MSLKKYPIAKPFIGKDEEREVLKVLRSGVLSIGKYVEAFEKEFARTLGVKYACAVSSGTAGLHLAMIAAGIKTGDEVITTPFSFVASANAILYVGAEPVFADIDPTTFNIDPKKIEEKITPRTKAILVVHIFGQAADMTQIMRIAKKHKLKIIEDACESVLATYRGKPVGTFGESAVFAFYPNKQMTTGEGGMVVTNDKRVDALCRSLRNQGRAENMQWLDHERLGYNYRLDEMSAAVGLVQTRKLKKMIAERQKIAGWYTEYLSRFSDKVAVPRIGADNAHTWFVYVVQVGGGAKRRNRIIAELSKIGVSTKPYLPSIHLFKFYRELFGYKKGDFPVSEQASANSLALPLYIGLSKDDVRDICEKLLAVV